MTLEEVKAILAEMERSSTEEQNEALRIAIRFMDLYQACARCHDCAKAKETSENEFRCTSVEYDVDKKGCFVLKIVKEQSRNSQEIVKK